MQASQFCFFPTASLGTAGARLLLALGFHEVTRLGAEVAYCDTDSLVIVSTHDGELVPCDGGPRRMADGRSAVLALSWKQVEQIRQRFESLNPYNPTAAGPLLKLEPENFADDGRTRSNLSFYGVSEKVYALFTLAGCGNPVIRKYSAHALGQYESPIPDDRKHEWIEDAWQRKISVALGRPAKPFAWEKLPHWHS